MLYVIATDKFKSNYGDNDGKITKLCFYCETPEIADHVFEKVNNYPILSDVSITDKVPRGNKKQCIQRCTATTHNQFYPY